QVTIGTLESLSRAGGGGRSGASSGGGAAADAARIEGMETQLRALSAEVQRLTREIRQMGGSDRGEFASPSRFASEPAARPAATRIEPSTTIGGFGSTTVRPEADPIGTLIEGAPREAALSPPVGAYGRETEVAGVPPAGAGNPKQDYEAAYGHLLRQDYGAAEVAFEEFLRRYPTDPLAGNAQYWLGETHFVRGNFKPAAAAFLKGYQNFAKGNKAPDSLLKLAMSLDRLGQKDAACSSFRELNAKFPQAPAHVKGRADGEMKRLACG
ncbi:MAG: tol-pal system protein YbgF, partial [Hyphomicrobiaceae bacterium]